MVNYYEILGIPSTSGFSEIKTAFRRLAKLYHPDKNPNGQEQFKKILKAYETLSDPSLKSSYDMKLKYHRNRVKNASSGTGTKNWSFEEKEMKRRQYYNEHYKKKQSTTTQTKTQTSEVKTSYNEYKYILYATPIAVALFLLIVNLSTTSKPKHSEQPITKEVKREIKTGQTLYTDHFGTELFAVDKNKSLTIKNNTGADIVVCLFNENKFIRSCFISDGFYAEIPQLPLKPIEVRYSSGKNWDYKKQLSNVKIYGTFTNDLVFYKCNPDAEIGGLNELTLTGGINTGFKEINQEEFFSKD